MFLKIALKTILTDYALESLFSSISKSFHRMKYLTIDDIKLGDIFSTISDGDMYFYRNCMIIHLTKLSSGGMVLMIECDSDRNISGRTLVHFFNTTSLKFYP